MKLEVFKHILNTLKSQEEKIDNAYKAGIDLINMVDEYCNVINTLFGVYYGKEGKEWIEWYLYERNEDDPLSATDKDGNAICYDDESLWFEVEMCRRNNKDEYTPKTSMTDEERQQFMDEFMGGGWA